MLHDRKKGQRGSECRHGAIQRSRQGDNDFLTGLPAPAARPQTPRSCHSHLPRPLFDCITPPLRVLCQGLITLPNQLSQSQVSRPFTLWLPVTNGHPQPIWGFLLWSPSSVCQSLGETCQLALGRAPSEPRNTSPSF